MNPLNYYGELLSYTLYIASSKESLSFEEVNENYKKLIERSRNLARENNFSKWKEYFFPVAAFIDEKILCSNLKDKQKWVKNKLQKTFFNTDKAGEEFFQKLNELSDEEKDLRKLYELCLALGFKGKYHEPSEQGKLEDLKYSNLKKITSDPNLNMPEVFFTTSYEDQTIRKKRKLKKWPNTSWKKWTLILLPVLILIGMYIFYSYKLNILVENYFKGV